MRPAFSHTLLSFLHVRQQSSVQFQQNACGLNGSYMRHMRHHMQMRLYQQPLDLPALLAPHCRCPPNMPCIGSVGTAVTTRVVSGSCGRAECSCTPVGTDVSTGNPADVRVCH